MVAVGSSLLELGVAFGRRLASFVAWERSSSVGKDLELEASSVEFGFALALMAFARFEDGNRLAWETALALLALGEPSSAVVEDGKALPSYYLNPLPVEIVLVG